MCVCVWNGGDFDYNTLLIFFLQRLLPSGNRSGIETTMRIGKISKRESGSI